MPEQISITATSREQKYHQLIPQLEALIEGETDIIANMGNVSAALKQVLGFFWIGFYLVKGEQLVLGPFQGPVACTRIHKGKGVCGQAWQSGETVVVPDVEKFPGHIACNAESKSEIVLPLKDEKGIVWAVLDVDSDKLDDFNSVDAQFLSDICALIKLPF
jgi:L-methionine (R)-S-oxide reductase